MYVCMYVCMYLCVHACMYICMYFASSKDLLFGGGFPIF